MFAKRKFRNLPNEKMDLTSENGGSLDVDDSLMISDWCDEASATLVTSLCEPTWQSPDLAPLGLQPGWTETHMPVIDLDIECHLVPSSTPGHSHLYINKPMPKSDLFKLLEVLQSVGVVEPGYVSASKRRGFSAVRHPRVRKPEAKLTAMPPGSVSSSYGL